jgi:bifunctional NMN adenylyltransferase/nudix hydrolase
MMGINMSKIRTIGAAPMRLQTPELHKGHIKLIETMIAENDFVIILLGVPQIKLSKRNPLDFKTRKMMVLSHFPKVCVLPLQDIPSSDEAWSKQLDGLITDVSYDGRDMDAEIDVTLYGSRDSFMPYYSGGFKIKEIAEVEGNLSATYMREQAIKEPVNSADFRRGVIYATNDRFNISYQTVDAFILSNDGYVLMGRKPNSAKHCMIGGFVEPSNPSLEEAVIREVQEETGLVITEEPQYLFSARVNDARYLREDDKIMTAVFLVPYNGDKTLAEGDDDIEEVRWVKLKDIRHNMFVDAHQDLVHKVLHKLNFRNY